MTYDLPTPLFKELMNALRIATRKSLLAMWQAEHVQSLLAAHQEPSELIPMVSVGDTDMRPIDGTRQVGVFTKRIQQALLDNEADIAVHSLKDLPTEGDPTLTLAAVPERETVEDALVSQTGWSLENLPDGSVIGTGSKRRGAQLLHHRPDLKIQNIRGNVQTRLEKLEAGEYDAIILAEAGILRLELTELKRTLLPLELMLPAPGQGALGIEVRKEHVEAFEAVNKLNAPTAHAAVHAERCLLASLHGGCLAPIAAYAEVKDQELLLRATVLSSDGKQRLDYQSSIELGVDWITTAEELANAAAEALNKQGATELIQSAR